MTPLGLQGTGTIVDTEATEQKDDVRVCGNQGGGAGRRGSEQRALIRGMRQWGVRSRNSASDAFKFPSGVNSITGGHGLYIEGREADIGARASRKDTPQVQMTSGLARTAEAGSAKRQNLRSELTLSQEGDPRGSLLLRSWSFSSLAAARRATVRGGQFGRVEYRYL